jgi:hypothetical protein
MEAYGSEERLIAPILLQTLWSLQVQELVVLGLPG